MKNLTISAEASGPLGSVYEPVPLAVRMKCVRDCYMLVPVTEMRSYRSEFFVL